MQTPQERMAAGNLTERPVMRAPHGSSVVRPAFTHKASDLIHFLANQLGVLMRCGSLLCLAALLAFTGSTTRTARAAGTDDAPADPLAPAAPVAPAINEERILGVMPNYETVNDPHAIVVPMTRKEKWTLGLKASLDPFNIASAGVGAIFSQVDGETPKYGAGQGAFAKRFAASVADCGTQNLFSAGLLAGVLHQDPRYFRRGPDSRVLSRIGYSLSRLFVSRMDSGDPAFNYAGILGMAMGIGASNLYYPGASRRGSVMLGRLDTSLLSNVVGNLTGEFWPDLQKKFFSRHYQTQVRK